MGASSEVGVVSIPTTNSMHLLSFRLICTVIGMVVARKGRCPTLLLQLGN
jgi:hypothetical protein